MTIGERIKLLRRGRMTQQDLATASDVSVDVIRKLEQGQRHTSSVATLHRIARALDTDIGELFGREVMPEAGPDQGVVALRRAITDVSDLLGGTAADPVPLAEAHRTVTYLWSAYWAGKYDTLTGLLPSALSGIGAALRDAGPAERTRAADALARTYWVAGCALAHLHQPDSAFIAVSRGLDLATQTDDELLAAALRGSISWQLLIQGRFDEAQRVARHAATCIEPVGNVSLPHLSAYGALLVNAANAAGRARRTEEARELLSAGGEISARIGSDRNDYETPFGPSQVTMQTVDVSVVTEDYDQALVAARAMPANPGLPLAARARHNTDRAFSHLKVGQDEAALNLLLATEGIAPDWMRHQTLARLVTQELLERERTRSGRLRALASRLKVARTR